MSHTAVELAARTTFRPFSAPSNVESPAVTGTNGGLHATSSANV